MEWKKGDIISAFADVPDMRCRAEHYQKLCVLRDQWLSDIHDFACSSDQDFATFEKLSRRVSPCASQLIWGANEKGIPDRLIWGNFCENDFCPICAKKKSLRLSRTLNCMMEKLYDDGYRFYHMVFSDKNCPVSDFNKQYDHYSKSWQRLVNSFIRPRYEGYYLSTEFTLNWNGAVPELHLHYHVIVACHPDKYRVGETFVDFETLRRLWARSLRIPKDPLTNDYEYLPFASCYEVRKGNGQIFSELTKYIFDFTDFFEFVREHPYSISFSDLYLAMHNKKFHRGSGVLKLSVQNLYFVQSTDAPEYIPEYCLFSGLSSNSSYYLNHVTRFNDCISFLDEGEVNVKQLIRNYVRHQAYFYGFNYKQSGKFHLPDWWEDLTYQASFVEDPSPNAPPGVTHVTWDECISNLCEVYNYDST